MTVTVVGGWDEAWMDPERTERRIWRQTIEGFNVDEWFMAPDRKTTTSRPTQFDSVEVALEQAQGKRVFLMLPSTVEGLDLATYHHPKDAVYVFGTTADSLQSLVRPGDDVVSLYLPNEKAEEFGHVVLGQVLYHRYLQERAI